CTLVKLSRKKFHRKCSVSLIHREGLFVQDIHRGLRKYASAGFPESLFGNVFCIISDQYTYSRDIGDSEIMTDLMSELFRRNGKLRFLFYIYALYITHRLSPLNEICMQKACTLKHHYINHIVPHFSSLVQLI